MDNQSDASECWSSLLRARVPMYDGMARRVALAQGMTAAGVRAEIDAVVDVLSKLRAYENILLAPAFAIPSEVLVTIFSFCASEGRPCHALQYHPRPEVHKSHARKKRRGVSPPPPPEPLRQQVGWMNFTQVCRQWRTVALNAASLWACINRSAESRTVCHEMLVRSRKAPLSLDLDIAHMGLEAAMELQEYLGEQEIQRLRQLTLREGWSRAENHPNKLLKQYALLVIAKAPQLTDLCLIAENPVDVLSNVSKLNMPSLRHLTLQECPLSWNSDILSNLLSLEVGIDYDFDDTGYPTAVELHSALQRMPRLRTLRTALREQDQPASVRANVASLPLLVDLRLRFLGRQGLDLVQALVIPETCRVELINRKAKIHPIVHGVLKVIEGPSTGPRTVDWDWDEIGSSYNERMGKFRLRSWLKHVDWCLNWGERPAALMTAESAFKDEVEPTFKLSAEFPDAPSNDAWKMDYPYLSNVKTLRLRLHDAHAWKKDRWFGMFQQATSVEVLFVDGQTAAVGLLYALAISGEVDDIESDSSPDGADSSTAGSALPTGRDSLLFPKLTTIILRNLASRKAYPLDGKYLDRFAKVLDARRKHGYPVSAVEIPYYDEEDRGMLTDIVRRLKKDVQVQTVTVAHLGGKKKFVAKRATKETSNGDGEVAKAQSGKKARGRK
ncbi:hypothetical protein FA95DRAFT_1592339 [Auriscalpium vulgare]|uniref:Uncharacterized protein n=1 Tax=Auriscalpium vulgare TaxID=40419 RepID=A0ACB8S9T6_9AGAM|nr:hypothetical protein FA95DRAFT_1592339 [Auriscalpium vulgare]